MAILQPLNNQLIKLSLNGIPLDNFESDYMREASFSWNPPVWDTLMAVNENNIDDHFDFDDFTESSQHDDSFEEEEPNVRGVTNNPDAEFSRVFGDSPDCGDADSTADIDNDNLTIHPANKFIQVISNNLTLQKLADVDTDLVIRAILLKNNNVVYNYSYIIHGTDNVQNSTISAANKVCDLYLGRAIKGDTLVCSLGAGHNGVHTSCSLQLYKYSWRLQLVHTSITRNVHI